MSIAMIQQSAASVPTPPAGEETIFMDAADDKFKKKTSTGAVIDLESNAGGVSSFNGRTGAVVPAINDYTSSQVANVPFGTIVNTNTQDALNFLDTSKISTSQKGALNGVATLDGSGLIPFSQIPPSLVGAVVYQGTWNASLNSPPLASGVGTKGFYYVVSVAGSTNLDGITDWKVGDWVIFNGAQWEQVDNTEAVTSVNGQTGTVVITQADVGLGNVDNTSDANKPISTATQNALNLKADLTYAMNQLTGEATAGPGGGSQAVTLSNAAVIAKVLTGLTESYGLVSASDTILQAIQKLVWTQSLQAQDINQSLTIPSNYNLVRGLTRLKGASILTIDNGAVLKLI